MNRTHHNHISSFAHQRLLLIPTKSSAITTPAQLRIPPATYCYTFQAAMRVWQNGHSSNPHHTHSHRRNRSPLQSAVIRTTDGQCTFLDTRDDHRYRQMVTAALQRSPPHHPILIESHVYSMAVREGRRLRGRMFRWVETDATDHDDAHTINNNTTANAQVSPPIATGVLEEGLVRKVGRIQEEVVYWVVRWTRQLPNERAETTDALYPHIAHACAQLVRTNRWLSNTASGEIGGEPVNSVEIGVCWVGPNNEGGINGDRVHIRSGIGWLVHAGRSVTC